VGSGQVRLATGAPVSRAWVPPCGTMGAEDGRREGQVRLSHVDQWRGWPSAHHVRSSLGSGHASRPRVDPSHQEEGQRARRLDQGQLDSYESIADDLTQCGYVRKEYIVHWVKGEYWDPRGASGWGESLVGQLALSDARKAEELLMQVADLHSFLLQPLPEQERANGWSEELVSSITSALDHLAERLGAGEYLTREDFAVWNRSLGPDRFTREGDRVYRSKASEISYIKEGPSTGLWWEKVRYFDSRLVDLAGLDVEDTHF
jgi:hypothetical protein